MRPGKRVPFAAAIALTFTAIAASAQEVVFKVEHFLGPNSTAQKQLLGPWCDKIAAESGGKLKCQIYPAMQLGGTPPQLFDQVKDGVVDIAWTVPTYQSGRFTATEVFELPFMTANTEKSSSAVRAASETRNGTTPRNVAVSGTSFANRLMM